MTRWEIQFWDWSAHAEGRSNRQGSEEVQLEMLQRLHKRYTRSSRVLQKEKFQFPTMAIEEGRKPFSSQNRKHALVLFDRLRKFSQETKLTF